MEHSGEIMVARRRRLMLRWSAGDPPGAVPEIETTPSRDIARLDSYSRAIAAAVARVGRAIVSVQSGAPDRARPGVGLGSALVVSPQGILLTSAQVVHDSSELTVRFPDGQRLAAKVIGIDPATDVGLLSVEAQDLPFLSLATERRVRIGDTVIAAGNAQGDQTLISTGVVVTLGRSLRSKAHRLLEGLVQHTAWTSPGTAGGALLDRDGNLVGILTESVAVGQVDHFAIASATAAWVLPQLHTRGKVRRGRIGVAGEAHELPEEARRRHGLSQQRGIAVLGVEVGGPAAVGGLQRGDWIVRLNGQSCASLDELDRFLAEWPLRRPLLITVLRGETMTDVEILPAEYGA